MNDLLEPSFPREELRAGLAALAREGVLAGTSSWKYEGWLGLLYTPERLPHARPALAREVPAKLPRRVRGSVQDRVPRRRLLPVPHRGDARAHLRAGAGRFPALDQGDRGHHGAAVRHPARYGTRAGKANPHFLDADLFVASFLGPLEPHRARMGAIIFEFSPFHVGEWKRGRDFVEALDGFLARLPRGWTTPSKCATPACSCPTTSRCCAVTASRTRSTVGRACRRSTSRCSCRAASPRTSPPRVSCSSRGAPSSRRWEKFRPYREVKEAYPPAREALREMLMPKPGQPRRRYLYVNNRLEGCSLWTLYAVLSGLIKRPVKIGQGIQE
ncbi:MAG: hypothetical protein WDO13_05000 [Verrucomicrobiota bacterium]